MKWLARRRRERTLAHRPIPEPLWQLTLARYPFLGERSAADLAELRALTTLFLAEKQFAGGGGFAITDEMATAIAAQACLPALRLGLEWYAGFVGIVVHADAVLANRESIDDDGVVHAWDEELSGETMHGGPVMLAWGDVDEAGETAAVGYNLVVHEFAHVIDMRAGLTAGAEGADATTSRGRWQRALLAEYGGFCAATDAGQETFLDPYGAEALEEFFAVAAEAFFVAPRELEAEEPATFELLTEAFRQRP